ncbi:MAG: ATP-binding cassette domain-containing protein [Lachnospiraceae bacterium]|nr:ATP-binding cassette domain-containing protein [Lachnospiraceae bacterium]
MNQEYIIEVSNVKKYFRETKALDDVSISFERGKIHGIIGRNGSGKTVLLKCICGLTPVTSGAVLVDGKRVGKDVEIPKNIGALIEHPGFIREYSGLANLKFLAGLTGKIDTEKLSELMESVELDPKSRKKVSRYSLGMQQRLGIAQAIMDDPDILILDEPTNGLDNRGVGWFREMLLKKKEEGKTVLIASHNSADIELLCDTVCEMDAGKILH